jgi:heme exporter protein A
MASATTFQLAIEQVSKAFGRRAICRDVTLELETGQSIAVVGPNGSGKSTFVKIIAGLIRPDRGRIMYRLNGAEIKTDDRYRHLGLVSPELALYEELSAYENLQFAAAVLGLSTTRETLDGLLDEFGILGRGDDFVGTYSSGMKHRLKFAAALLKNPPLLLLDEPTVMLDDDGTARVWQALARRHLALVIATNDSQEAARADRQVRMGADGE